MYDPRTINIPPGYGKIRFGRVEMLNIGLAVGVLTLAFTLYMVIGITSIGSLTGFPMIAYAAGVSFAAVITGFMLHELAHKVVAQRNGAWAEFRAYPLGLLLSIFFSLLGVILAMPGAVYIQGMISKKQNGLISLAGPLVNLGLGVVFLFTGLWLHDGLIAIALYWIGSINLFLAFFNLLPIPPLDGSKVWKWSIPAYVVSFGFSIVMVALLYTNYFL